MKTKPGNTVQVPACPVRVTSFSLVFRLLFWLTSANTGHFSCRPVSPGGRKQISSSSEIQLSPHPPTYVLAKVHFHS